MVEPPGIEPGSFATSPGLLRAQFARDLCSTLQRSRTSLDDGPSCSKGVPYDPSNKAERQVPLVDASYRVRDIPGLTDTRSL